MTDPRKGASDDSEALQKGRRLVDALVATLTAAGNCPVSRVETHISWVLLADGFAYKIKKPVNLGFLDFSSLARRREFCREELRLNRRLAPALYLDVAAVTGDPQRPQLDGPGEVLEYAVRMRRFPESCRLDHMLAAGVLESRHLRTLARRMAAFHRSAAPAPPGSSYGDPDSVRAPVLENFRQLRGALPQARLRALQEWSVDRLRQLQSLIVSRRKAGRVRECHGDLHLGNLVALGEEVTAFDCIEFDPALRWIDVASEIAFLYMDLMSHGRADLACRFLNDYWMENGDYEAGALLGFYAVYRSLVRAKVAAIGDREAHGTTGDVSRYADFAEHLIRAPCPPLILMHGLSGSGKSRLSERLVEAAGAVRLRSDVERKRLSGLPPDARTGAPVAGGIYTPEASRQTYQRLLELANGLLRGGVSTIVDASFLRREQRAPFIALAHSLDAPVLVIDCRAPEKLLEERVVHRGQAARDASEADLAVLRHQRTVLEAPLAEEGIVLRTVDTAAGPDLAALLSVLRTAGNRPETPSW